VFTPVLITGATGFAGGHLVERLAGSARLVAWGRSFPRAGLADLAEWQQIDLLDRTSVREAIARLRPSAVYHLAGAPHVAESWRDTARPLRDNVLATSHLLEAISRAGLPCRVLVTGSAAVYAPSESPLAEDAPLAPSSPYALSKLAQEQLALRVCADEGVQVITVRPFNHTGPRQRPDFVVPALARQLALVEAGLVAPVVRTGNLDPRRDFTDVRDVVAAYVELMEHGRPGETYNVGSGIGRSIRSVLDALLARSPASVSIETDPARLRPSDVPSIVADASRLNEATGWQARIPFEQTLDDLLDYWRREVGPAGGRK
jgi:GDP-4-dehydro-6-deoxy-D-mannose reductase